MDDLSFSSSLDSSIKNSEKTDNLTSRFWLPNGKSGSATGLNAVKCKSRKQAEVTTDGRWVIHWLHAAEFQIREKLPWRLLVGWRLFNDCLLTRILETVAGQDGKIFIFFIIFHWVKTKKSNWFETRTIAWKEQHCRGGMVLVGRLQQIASHGSATA